MRRSAAARIGRRAPEGYCRAMTRANNLRVPDGSRVDVLKDLVRRVGVPTGREPQTETTSLRRLGEPAAAETERSQRGSR